MHAVPRAAVAAAPRRAPVPPPTGGGDCVKRRRTTLAPAALGEGRTTPPPPPPPPPAAPSPASSPSSSLPPELERAWTARVPTKWHDLEGPGTWQGTEEDAFQGASPLAALSRAQRLLLLSDGSVTRHLQIVLGAAGGGNSPSGGGGGSGGGGWNGSGNGSRSKGAGSGVHVECLAMDLLLPPETERSITPDLSLPPPERDATALLRPPLLRRQVLLRAAPGAPVPGPPFAPRSSPRPRVHDGDGQEEEDEGDDASDGAPLVYAASWWNAADAAAFLGGDGAAERPIWSALTSGKMELHRRVLGVSRGANARLWSPLSSSSAVAAAAVGGGRRRGARGLLGAEDDWAAAGPGGVWGGRQGEAAAAAAAAGGRDSAPGPPRELWGRHYVFWAGGRPLTVIHEVFSPRLMAAVDASCGVGR